jgi:FkbM family methyltransferase
LPPETLLEQATRYEHLALRGHLALLLSRLGVNCVLDVGAFEGGYAGELRAAGYEGWIVSIEPVGSSYGRLRGAADADPRWRTLQLALGSESEQRSINVAGNAVLSSFLPHSTYALHELGEMTRTVEVEHVAVRTLDDVIGECTAGIPDPRLFLKIDTQGWDLEVLKGAAATLPAVLGVQVELSLKPIYEGMPAYAQTMGHLQELGFEPTGIYPVVRDRDMRVMEVDCVLVRPGAITA